MKPSTSKKRSIESEHRCFQEKWEIKYFFIQEKGKIFCLICRQTILVCKEYNIKRHHNTFHNEEYKNIVGKMREEKLIELKAVLRKQQSIFTKPVAENVAAVTASYRLSHAIAKKSKSFMEGDFISECLIIAAEELCPNMINKFKSISLSRNTVANRITDIASNLRDQLRSVALNFEVFSIAIDESTDLTDIAQLAVFIRGCDRNMTITEELLEVIPMHGTTTGDDIFDALMIAIKKYNLPMNNLVSLATDGAPSMTGVTRGVVGRLKAYVKTHHNRSFQHFHCIIHQQVLCSKVIKIDNVFKTVAKVVNFIRARRLNHREFMSLLNDVESEYEDLPYYTYKILKRGFRIFKVASLI